VVERERVAESAEVIAQVFKGEILIRLKLFVVAAPLIFVIGSAAQVIGAAAQQPQPELTGEMIPNLGEVKSQIKHYYDCDGKSGCYEADLETQAARGIEFLKQRAAKRAGAEKLAIVLDIDETCLSNYPYYLITDFGYESARFDMWAMAANAAPIKPMLKLYNTARELRFDVFFITGRSEHQRFATEQNLEKAGYKGWVGLTLRGSADAGRKAAEYKSAARKKIVEQGYRIVLNVGDQQSDLAGDPQAEMSLKVPNPFYSIP
jgi:acid phosphatase